MIEDSELLRRYAEERSETAFAELVQRHVGFVYAAALRQLGGATHRAEEVSQTVFIALARKAGALSGRRELAGWLYTSTHYACAKLKRTEQRRQEREFKAFTMNESLSEAELTLEWERLRPVLDDAIHELNDRDRELILLRFFHGSRFTEMARDFALSEDAVRMRVERALARLRAVLARKEITSTSAALAFALSNQPAVAVPAALGTTITNAVLASCGTAAIGAAVPLFVMKAKTTIAALAALLAVGFGSYQLHEANKARASTIALQAEHEALKGQLHAQQARAAAAEDQVAALKREANAARSITTAKPFALPAPTQTSLPGQPVPGTITFRPSTPEEAREIKVQNLDKTYAALYRQLGLPPAQQDQFRRGLLEQQESAERLFKTAIDAARAQNPNLDRAAMLEIFEATNAQMHVEQQAVIDRMFGASTSHALARYHDTLPMRSISSQLANALFDSSHPLTPAGADQLTDIMAQHARGPIGKVEVVALNIEAAVAQAQSQGVLNASQADELRRVARRAQGLAQNSRAKTATPTASRRPDKQ